MQPYCGGRRTCLLWPQSARHGARRLAGRPPMSRPCRLISERLGSHRCLIVTPMMLLHAPIFLRGSCWPRPCSVALPAACLLTGAYHQGFPRLNKASATASVAFAWCLNTLTDVMSFRGLPQFSAARSVCRGAIWCSSAHVCRLLGLDMVLGYIIQGYIGFSFSSYGFFLEVSLLQMSKMFGVGTRPPTG